MATKSVATDEHCFYCFDALHARLNDLGDPEPGFEGADEEYPLFVTWNIVSRRTGEIRLRGCIGNFEAMPLGNSLRDYATISALKDSRFDPISLKELPRLECGVSLLTKFELCFDLDDWDIGTHGIYIQLPNPAVHTAASASSSASNSDASLPLDDERRRRPRPSYKSMSQLPPLDIPTPSGFRHHRAVLTATYLPEVAPAQGWTKEEAIDSLIRKAGYSQRITPEIRRTIRLSRYQSHKANATYAAWKQTRGL